MKKNFLIEIKADNGIGTRFITVYADDLDAAWKMGEVAAEAMREEWHKGRDFSVTNATALE